MLTNYEKVEAELTKNVYEKMDLTELAHCIEELECEVEEVKAKELKLDFFYTGILDKKEGFETLLKEQNLAPEECMYIGDDIVDARPMALCGLAVAVGDAVPELDRIADLRTRHAGGNGAVREAIEFLLKEQNRWDSLMTRYFDL